MLPQTVKRVLRCAPQLDFRRGLNGSFTLAHDPERLPLMEVIHVADPIRWYSDCLPKKSSYGRCRCLVHHRLVEAAVQFEGLVRESRISELFSVPRQREATYRFPGVLGSGS